MATTATTKSVTHRRQPTPTAETAIATATATATAGHGQAPPSPAPGPPYLVMYARQPFASSALNTGGAPNVVAATVGFPSPSRSPGLLRSVTATSAAMPPPREWP
eukprot:364516-Chlamydomonas_euryale.AAC.22